MDEYKIKIAVRAEQDLREIHAYIAKNLKEPAKMLDKIEAEIQTLRQMPQRHALERDEQLKQRNLRKLIVENYLVFYTAGEKAGTVHIVRILYAGRDWFKLL